MRGQHLKSHFSLMFTFICLGTLLTTLLWSMVNNRGLRKRGPIHYIWTAHFFRHTPLLNQSHRKRRPTRRGGRKHRTYQRQTTGKELKVINLSSSDVVSYSPPRHKKSHPPPTKLCEGCKEILDKVKELYSTTWEKHEYNYQKIRLQLSSECNGFDKAIITQANTPVGSKIVYDGEKKRSLNVTSKIFSTFAKEHPFQNKTRDTCAVVGNGGILTNSSCGKMIDSAQFVIRCNLPPLENGYEEDVGIKTDLVTANPSIFLFKYHSLLERHRPFVDSLHSYGNSLLLCPAFSYGFNTNVCQRAAYSVEDFEIPMRPVYLNPDYLLSLVRFWRSQGLKENRHSTGLMMVSLALELCTNVHLYGFWPYGNHPHGLYALTNHYYDDVAPKKGVHTMSSEFELLLRLHNQGILRLHLEDCSSD
ncbi:alpha-2,8-sialyltransferase 8E-like isoform X2 [Epinephelus fuscoguttatus]|uniref:alpha-2,8-sialyltransferase 8E-like isoform X2 n=1 Tax=Epinephelus fuscoguttatus TaxID=293821 RepID=UPI0020D1B8FC|nr:alpha-2,8-sialyltransferase 8E-like isoform X2 [Epinephelus fuscoguttatus]